jgi:putative heme-binding domain-containing protein
MIRNPLVVLLLSVFVSLFDMTAGRSEPPAAPMRLQVPPGFIVEKVAGPPLVRYPLFAAFDDRGRLFVAEGTGTNLPGPDLLKLTKQLGRITLLEDTKGDGKFDKAQVFADDLVFPTGVLWHDGAVYATSHPNLWRFEDTKGTGRADRREALVSRFNFNGNGCDIHGPFLGPDGRLYWTDGRHGYKVQTREGPVLEGFASRVWRGRPDGTGIERLSGGGFDNPVELAFTPQGDVIGTMDQGPGDALLHYIEGGVYPMDHPCVKEFAMTGPMLGAVRQFSAALPVALCGLTRYRSTQFGREYQGSLFTAQFNVHRVQQHILVRDGATFRCIDKDFLSSTDYDTHFTDVLEDADGSLLVVDMGAWFNYGCPTSKIAKPEILGAIYRIRRTDAPAGTDPWGKSLDLAAKSAAELTLLLDDPRPKVRDRVVERLGKLGDRAVPTLAAVLDQHDVRAGKGHSVQARRNAIWALCRIRGAEARKAVRIALADKDASVRQAAIHAAGLEADAAASDRLRELVVKDEPPLRLKAAEALGRIGQAQAVPALLESLRRGNVDRFLEHALIYALIRINQPQPTLTALEDTSPRVRQAGLVALDQMSAGKLTREQVVPLLDTDDPDLQQAALDVISRRPGWARDTIGLLRAWLGSERRSAAQERSLTGALLGFGGEAPVQALVAETLADTKTTISTRLLLIRVITRCRLDRLPSAWLAALGRALDDHDLTVRREVVVALKARNLGDFDGALMTLSRRENLPADLRIAALDCLAGRQAQLDGAAFALLTNHLSEKTEPLLRVAAARALGGGRWDTDQLLELAAAVAESGPMIVPLLLPAFAKSKDETLGGFLVNALKRSPGADALAPDALAKLLAGYPAEVRVAARPLQDKLALRGKEQAAYLARLTGELLETPGDVERGKQVFLSKKAACYSCHRAAGKGGNVGPDLSQVGRFRTPRDLLESIVFPSSSIVPEYRSYVVATRNGQLTTGMIVRESAEAIYLRTAQLAEIRIARADVEEMTPSAVSIMPEGLEKTMTRQDLSDLLEFLYRQR